MPISKEQLGNIIAGRAASLCKPEFDNVKSRGNVSEGRMMSGGPDPSMYDADAAKWDAMYYDSSDEDYNVPQSRDIPYSSQGAARSQMPDSIKKSMMENRIDVSALGEQSVVDKLGIKGKPLTAPTQRRQQVTEQRQPVTYGNVGGVDYSIIKAIVAECIRDYFERQPINEGTLKSVMIKEGNISFINGNGDVYQAKLKKVGNVQKNKNGGE